MIRLTREGVKELLNLPTLKKAHTARTKLVQYGLLRAIQRPAR